ncbi:STAS domain-containing protein [Mesobacillus foraminis]|uniref:STAS domain-containing protein n=1 Tax=Mesobacillus foraminis TaxID=279826 RepID=UPI000EF47D6F|nr:STAS domain-containing protein [Mesobacillus foraminis]
MEKPSYTYQSKEFQNFDEAADSILKVMSRLLDINTLFIAKNDLKTNEIVKVLNKEETLLREGDTLPFRETLCKLSVEHGNCPLIIPDLAKSELTRSMGVTNNLGGGCFIGIPVYYENGVNYGTICGLDNKPYNFKEEHIELFITMGSLLSYVLELDEANRQIQNLAAPMVPITKGVAILPIIGHITDLRAENILITALKKSEELSLSHLIIDLSGIIKIDDMVSDSLLRIANSLRLIGVKPVLTGFSPEMARKAATRGFDSGDIVIKATLEQALNQIGFVLKKEGESLL